MNAKQVLAAVPMPVWFIGGGVLVLALVGGERIGKWVAGLASGAIDGAADGAGQVAVSLVKAPARAIDSAISAATGRDESLGTWLYGAVDSVYGIFGYDDASVQARLEEQYRLEYARRQAEAMNNYTRGGGSSRGGARG